MSCPVDRLTADFDHHDPEFTPDLARRVHRAVQEQGRVARSSAHGGVWVLSHHADVDAALRDHETFASGHGVFFPRAAGTPRFAPLEYDPPEQTWYRGLMRPPFTPARAKEAAAAITELVAELVRPVVQRGHGDLVAELATPLPLAVVGAAVGFSAGARARIRELTSNTWKGMPKDADSGGFWPPFAELFRAEIRRAREEPGDDHLSTLVRTRVDGELIAEDDLHVMLVAYAIAGHETTMNTIGHLCWVLARRPDLQDLLREHPELRLRAVEKTLRLWAPVDHGTRVTTREVEVGGTTIPAGARVVLLTGAANRDPAVFDDPDEFRLDRPHNRHLTFGQGVHFCLGAHHARTEFLAVLDELAKHRNYRLTAEPVRYFENGRHICVDRLQIAFG